MENDNKLDQNGKSTSTLDQRTHTIIVMDEAGKLVPEPPSIAVNKHDVLVWSYDGPTKFYISFSSSTRFESHGDNGHQSLSLPVAVVMKRSTEEQYDIGLDGASDSSSFVGIITCSTCGDGD